jgi:signal transduction histidine kinase
MLRYYPVAGETLPDFANLAPFQSNTVNNFILPNLPHVERIGAQFTGFISLPHDGLYAFHLKSDDGSRLYVGAPAFSAAVLGPTALPPPRRIMIGQVVTGADTGWSEVEGKVALVRKTETGLHLELTAGAGSLPVEIGNDTGLNAGDLLQTRVRATGFCQGALTADGQRIAGVLLVPTAREIVVLDPPPAPDAHWQSRTNGALPLLTTAAEVHRLKREEAQRAYPVRVRGVVTCVLPEHQAFTIQDATRGLYVVDFSSSLPGPPETGEFLEVEGTTDPGLFAPSVNARRVSSHGVGRLPDAVRPTWDQLINGSLDAQQVELQGIVTAVHTNGLTLLVRGGVVKVELRLAGRTNVGLEQFENALVRIRGCLLAFWDYVTHQVKMGEMRIYAADILLDQPAPQDLFSSPRKTAGELLQFDPQAGVFQRVKVSGQIVHARGPEFFLMDGRRGLRFTPKQPVTLSAGDTVEVVGFPDLLGSASPVLREAVVRKTGSAPLPAAPLLPADKLIQNDHDATRVTIEGLLVNVRQTAADIELELQNGVRTFVARLNDSPAKGPALATGSRLELTGVYAGLAGNRAAGQEIAAFELLLGSPADIRVLARPPWWTLKRLLFIVGALAFVLAAAALWITQLHRQVDERTAELGAQIQQRQHAEHQHAMEQERARIAQDLHDELGSGITEISMLAARARAAEARDHQRDGHLDQVGGKARELVTVLDEIVWATNPQHDSLASLVSYFSLYADRFLGLAGIAWRLEGPTGPPDHALSSRLRHQLLLVFKEALHNVVRHAAATEVRVGVHLAAGQLRLVVADNGRGLPQRSEPGTGVPAGTSPPHALLRSGEKVAKPDEVCPPGARGDGIRNMRLRVEKLGGRFEITSAPGPGTTVRCDVPTTPDLS